MKATEKICPKCNQPIKSGSLCIEETDGELVHIRCSPALHITTEESELEPKKNKDPQKAYIYFSNENSAGEILWKLFNLKVRFKIIGRKAIEIQAEKPAIEELYKDPNIQIVSSVEELPPGWEFQKPQQGFFRTSGPDKYIPFDQE